jgi:integrase
MSIRKRGKAWEIVIEMKDENDKRVQKTFTFHGSKPDAKLEEARLRVAYQLGITTKGKMTLEQFMLQWLEVNKKRTLAVRTYESYKETITVHIAKDKIGAKQFDRITPAEIQRYYNRKLDEGLSSTSVLYHHRILHAAYNRAVKDRIIPWGMNPLAAVDPPEKSEFKPHEFSPEQMAYIIMNTVGNPIRLPVIISSMTGVRAGEACGLRWPDIDFERMTVYVHKARKKENGEHVLGPTKNKKVRYVPLTPGLAMILQWHKDQQDKHKSVYKKEYNDEQYVLAWEDGRPYLPHYLTDKFTKAIKDLKYSGDPTFHACRHFYASAMHNAGASDKMITDALGHGPKDTNKTTAIYIHTELGAMRQYIDWLDDAILKGFLEEIDAHIPAHKVD